MWICEKQCELYSIFFVYTMCGPVPVLSLTFFYFSNFSFVVFLLLQFVNIENEPELKGFSMCAAFVARTNTHKQTVQAAKQPTTHQIRSNHTHSHRLTNTHTHIHTKTHSYTMPLSMHSVRHRNFILLVTRKIWLTQYHQNNLSSFFFNFIV